MSDEDFQQRLQRIAANTPQPQSAGAQHSGLNAPKLGRARGLKPRYSLIGAGGGIMALGIQGVKYTNAHYEALKDSGRIATAMAIGVAGIAIFLLGIFVMSRGVTRRLAESSGSGASQYPSIVARPVRQPSNWARFLFSLLGLILGIIATLYMFASGAALFFDTEKAHLFTVGAVSIAMGLAILALLFGIVGLFLRGRGLGRVPVYFVFGAVLTYSAMWISRVNMADWPLFAAQMQ